MKILPGPTASRIEGRTSIVAGLKYSRHPLPNITKKNNIHIWVFFNTHFAELGVQQTALQNFISFQRY